MSGQCGLRVCYGESPQDVANNVTRSIAPASQVCRSRMQPVIHRLRALRAAAAVERVRAAREAIDQSRADVWLTARAECSLSPS